MLKKIALVIVFMSIATGVFAQDPWITSDTIVFGSAPYYHTFNSVFNWIKISNFATTKDCYLSFEQQDAITTSSKGLITISRASDYQSPNSVEFNVRVRRITIIADTASTAVKDRVEFVATGERDLNN